MGWLDPAAYSIAILAGGEGRRMGGPKLGLMLTPDVSALDWAWRTIRATGLSGCTSVYEGANLPVAYAPCVDAEPGGGPLMGLRAVLAQSQTPYVLVWAVDQPGVTVDVLQRLVSVHVRTKGATLITSTDTRHGFHPFPGVYAPTLIPLIDAILAQGKRSLHALVAAVGDHERACFPDEVTRSLNTPDDVAAWRRLSGFITR